MEGVQYEEAHQKYREGTTSMQIRVCNTDQLHHQYERRTTKTAQSNCNLDFILMLLYSDIDKIPLVC